MFRRFTARKITVEADDIIKRPGKFHQTGTHNATIYDAKKNVSLTVDEQYHISHPSESHPPVGSRFEGDSAVISARKKNHVVSSGTSKKKGVFTDNVVVHISSEDRSSDVKKGARRR